MEYYISELANKSGESKTAGVKARDDLEYIWNHMGHSPIFLKPQEFNRAQAGLLEKYRLHRHIAGVWKRGLMGLAKGDTLYIQLPTENHSIYLSGVMTELKNRGVRLIGFIHDLECLRLSGLDRISFKERARINFEELSLMRRFTYLVVHNNKMKRALAGKGIDEGRLIPLKVFDYMLGDGSFAEIEAIVRRREKEFVADRAVVIAGNLSPEKAGYLKKLPLGCDFHLYGVNCCPLNDYGKNVCYMGSHPPEELPFNMKGQFGLVWDGDSVETCSGVYGRYLEINNPHKLSLYLVSGLPVIIWRKSAMADFVVKKGLGVAVDSLREIRSRIRDMSENEYKRLCRNVVFQGGLLSRAHYTKRAINICEETGMGDESIS